MSYLRFFLNISLLTTLLAGCAEDDKQGAPGAPDTGGSSGSGDAPLVAPASPSIQTKPIAICQLDADCEAGTFCFVKHCVRQCSDTLICEDGTSCDDRGRCGGGRKALDTPDERAGYRVVDPPSRKLLVAAGATEIRVELSIVGEEVPDALSFRAEDSLGSLDAFEIREAPVLAGRASIVLPFDGAALATAQDGLAVLTIDTKGGRLTFDLNLLPKVAGIYLAQVRLSTLGNTEVPISFEVVTSPTSASLESADAAWLVLQNSPQGLFSPSSAVAGTEQARPLTYDAVLDQWVATFQSDFALPTGSGLAARGVVPQRKLRFELSFDPSGEVSGAMSDTWSGFFDLRTAAGVREAGLVVLDGELFGARAEDGRATSNVQAAELVPVRADAQTPPPLDACSDAMFATRTVGGVAQGVQFDSGAGRIFRCESTERNDDGSAVSLVDSVAAFTGAGATDAVRADCALAMSGRALSQGTTAELLQQFFDGDGTTPGGRSFDAFMLDCAQGVGGICRPSPAVLCARQLVAYAFAAPVAPLVDEDASLLSDAFDRLGRESYLGQQLGAFQSDAALRLSWLKATDLPTIVTAQLRSAVSGLLATWQTSVLDVQMGVVAGQYDAAAMAMLGRQVAGPAAAQRRQSLFEMSQGWRGAVDALALGTRRWNELLQGNAERAERSGFVTTRTLDFYLYAAIGATLNLRGDAGFANATYGSGLTELAQDALSLSLPFSELVSARDGDVVVSQSLDPSSTNANLLGSRKDAALAAVEAAQASVSAVITQSTERELTTAMLQNRLSNEIDAVVDELIQLCGLPRGCTRAQVISDPACKVAVEMGRCGYDLQTSAGGVEDATAYNVSDAAEKLLAYDHALQGVLISESELRGLTERAALAATSAQAFAANLDAWNQTRLASANQVDSLIAARAGQWRGRLAELTESISSRNALRRQLANDAKADAATWDTIRDSGAADDYSRSLVINALQGTAKLTESIGKWQAGEFLMIADALPSMVGVATDAHFRLARKTLLTAGGWKRGTLRVTAGLLNSGAVALTRSTERAQYLREAELEGLRDADIGQDFPVLNEILTLQESAELTLTAEQIAEFEVDRIIAALRSRAEAELAYERDKIELKEKADRLLGLLVDIANYDLNINQASMAVVQRLLEIKQVSAKAERLDGRLRELQTQQTTTLSLIGSPSVVFAWANKLAQAESRLDRAKEAMLDWLVAMEYYAVRPFMDQRVQLLLAKNPAQLSKIAEEMVRLTADCGGNSNASSVTVSLARLLGQTVDRTESIGGEVVSPAEQFRAALERADVAVSRQARVGGASATPAFWRNPDVWALEFPVDLATFPNLAATCNAKVLSFDVSLIGEGLGEAQPTVTLVHTGSSRLRSCQPDLNDYVAQFGAGATRFADITRLRTAPLSISPIAEIGGFASEPNLVSGNLTLGGLPIAADYILVIDRGAGENPDINWNNLEDVQIRVNFSTQDFFARNRCL